MKRRSFLKTVASGAAAFCATGAVGPLFAAQKKKLNFIFILVDDYGWTDAGCYGSDLYETPNIDRLAKQGVKFTNGYSACTVCSPTRASVMTGKYPARLHITDWIQGHKRPRAKLSVPDWTMYLPHEEETIAEAMKAAGYATCHIGKWHLGNEEYHPDKQGFDHNIGGYHRGQPPSYFSPYKIPTLEEGPDGEYLTDREAAEACKFVADNKDNPFFLYLPHYAVHTPLQAKKEMIEEYKKKIKPGMRHTNPIYASMVTSVDDSLGRIMETLEKEGLADNTVIFFTGDNGGLLKRSTVNIPLRAGKGSSYEGGVRVPLLVKWPGVTKAGSVCDEPVISPDFYPTILEMANVKGKRKHNANVDGESIVPVLKDTTATLKRDNIFFHYPHYHPGGATPYGAVRARDWKLIEFYEDMHVELYNLKEDIGETTDLAAKLPEKARELRKVLHDWRADVGAQMPTANPNYQPKENDRQLKELEAKRNRNTQKQRQNSK